MNRQSDHDHTSHNVRTIAVSHLPIPAVQRWGLSVLAAPTPADLAIVMRARRPRGVHELSTVTGHGTEWLDAHDRESCVFPDWNALSTSRRTDCLSLVIMRWRVRSSHPAPRSPRRMGDIRVRHRPAVHEVSASEAPGRSSLAQLGRVRSRHSWRPGGQPQSAWTSPVTASPKIGLSPCDDENCIVNVPETICPSTTSGSESGLPSASRTTLSYPKV